MNFRHLLKKGSVCYVAFFLLLSLFTVQEMKAQQPSSVSGTITDAAGLTLPGVNVVEKGTRNSASTDFSGNFNIKLTKETAVLQVSFVGFVTQEVNVKGKSTVKITLVEESQSLKEVVIVGYGSVKKTDLTGAVNTLSSAKITERNVTNPLEAIQGGIAGVQVTSNSGRLGDGFNVVIRGSNSINKDGSKPLFVIDGVPTDNMDFLNPQDIARMDVLKDASSAAIYGSRGASGVIIVTTKGGASAKSGINVSYETSYGNKQVARLPQFMSGEKWWSYHQAAFLPTSLSSTVPNYASITPALLTANVGATGTNNVLLQRVARNQTFDWTDAVLRGAMTQNNYLSISGRGESGMAYNLAIGQQKETGNVQNESIDKYTFKAGINHQVNSKFGLGVNLTLSKTDEQLGSPTAMQEAFRQNPFTSPWAIDAAGNEIIGTLALQPGTLRYPNGTLAINKTGSINPLLEIENSTDQRVNWTTIGNVFAEYKATSWLTFKTTFSAGKLDSKRGKAFGPLTNIGIANKNLLSGEIDNLQNFNYTWDNQFNINYTLNTDHVFNFLGLQSLYSNTTETSFLSSRENPFDTDFNNLGSGPQNTYNVRSNFFKNTLNSYAARLNYTFKGRYLLTGTIRADGSSVLAKGNKWASFPSVAVGWKVNEESFLKDVSFISNLKLRASLGYTGNDNVTPYSSLSVLRNSTFYDYNSTTLSNGFIPSSLGNPELTWERTRETNFGLDFGFLRNRISGSVDVYDRLSDDLLFQQALPLEMGIPIITSNVGSVSNKGVEVALSTKNIQTKNVTWETSFTFTKNVNKLVSIYNQKEVSDVGNNLFLGENINSYYNFVFDGVWQESERAQAAIYNQLPGEARVKDLNNDGRIDGNNDRAILGNFDPKWTGSFSTSLKVHQFDFGLSLIANQGMTVFSDFHNNFADVNDRGRQKLDLQDWYVPANGAGIPQQFSNTNPLPRAAGVYYTNNDVAFYKDASFVKIQNMSFGYSFDDELLEKLKIKYLRLYVNVLNPFVFTNYEGYDPEWATASQAINRVASTTIQMGVSLKF
ncbi:TonB-dependent receptor [Flavobacterium sp. SOK18b]|uniref:SusC/RagA family TonB-linked outer membrane protein n=1 Tax=Flavobacterium sp. SOK18b TaxID=797900 RepID=UPI002107B4B6|nr:TonB-dependent receptor [Flavobacterium sp. SOK18b]